MAKIESISISYGRTPYGIHCNNCDTSLDTLCPSGIGWHLYEEHAVQAYQDMCKAIDYLRCRRIKPTPQRIAEYWYREAKGLGHNPDKVDPEYIPTNTKIY